MPPSTTATTDGKPQGGLQSPQFGPFQGDLMRKADSWNRERALNYKRIRSKNILTAFLLGSAVIGICKLETNRCFLRLVLCFYNTCELIFFPFCYRYVFHQGNPTGDLFGWPQRAGTDWRMTEPLSGGEEITRRSNFTVSLLTVWLMDWLFDWLIMSYTVCFGLY